MATKKVTNTQDVDPTKQKQATTQTDVNAQDSRTRLWQSLKQGYDVQKDNTTQEYAKAYSQADRQALARGMGRSSYNNQTLANINEQKIKALGNIDSALIADYQNRLTDLENQEKEEAWRQKQFDEQVRQFNEGQAFQREQNELSRQFTTSEREASQAWQAEQTALGQQYQTAEREAQQAYSTAEREAGQQFQSAEAQKQRDAQLALQKLSQEFQHAESELSRQGQKDLQLLQQEWQSGENLKSREAQEALQRLEMEFQSGENEKSREAQRLLQELSQQFQASESTLDRALKQGQFETQMEYQKGRDIIEDEFREKQWQEQTRQWEEQFGYQQKSDDQKLAYQYLMSIIEKGGTPSDELLERAGLSKQDLQQMKTDVKKSGGGGYRSTGLGSGAGTTGTTTGSSTVTAEQLAQTLKEIADKKQQTADELQKKKTTPTSTTVKLGGTSKVTQMTK